MDITILASQLMGNIRLVKNEQEVTKLIAETINDLRIRGLSDLELIHLVQQVHSQLHSLDPVAIDDSLEWNMILHAKVELFRMGRKMGASEN